MNNNASGNGHSASLDRNRSEERQIELLAFYDEALATGSTIMQDPSTELPADDRTRFQANQKCLRLLEQVFPRHGRALNEVDDAGDETINAGERVGRFTLVRKLGRGSFGIVYLADDPVLSRQVALKVPRANVLLTPQLRDRFLREARAAGRLNHPNLIRVLDAGSAGLMCFIVSDYCAGPTLAHWVKTNAPCQARLAARLVLSIARAVAYIHSQGILHRDIKPSNILLEPVSEPQVGGEKLPFTPRLTDFGLARLVDTDATETVTGAILGTPAYMAPEQALGRSKDVVPASDVYSLGAVLYELCTGRRPSSGSEPLEVLNRLISEEVIPPRQLQRRLPRDLEAICLKCLERDSERRYATADALAEDLERLLEGRSTVARRVSLWKRGVKQARRHPKLSMASGLCALMTLAVVVAGVSFQRQNARHALALSRIEERQQQVTIDREYGNSMLLAQRYWRDGRHADMHQVLAGLCPTDAEKDQRDFAWHYLWHQSLRRTFEGRHQSSVDQLAFTGKWLTSTSSDGLVNYWDIDTFRLHRTLQLPRPTHGSMLVSADQTRFLSISSGDSPARLRCFNAVSGVLYGEHLLTEKNPMFACSHDGHMFAVGTKDMKDGKSSVMLWNPETGETRLVWEHQGSGKVDDESRPGTLAAIQFSPDGRRFAVAFYGPRRSSGTQRCDCEIVDVENSVKLAHLATEHNAIMCLAFSGDGHRLATSDYRGNVRIWSMSSFKEEFCLTDMKFPIRCMEFSPDGKLLACGMNYPDLDVPEDSDWVAVWDLEKRSRVNSTPPIRALPVHSLCFSPYGQALALGCGDQVVRVWDLVDPQHGQVLAAHSPAEAWGIAFACDGDVFASSGDDHFAKLWDARSKKEIARCVGAPSLVTAVAFVPNRPLLATAGYDGVVRLCDTGTGKEVAKLVGHTGPVRSINFNADGKLLISAGDDKTIKVWDVENKKVMQSLHGHNEKVRHALFAPGDKVVSGGNDEMIYIWDRARGKVLHSIHADKKVWSMARAPTEPLLAVATEEAEIEILSTETWKFSNRLSGHADGVLCVAFSPDGKTLASGGLDRSVRLWHVATGQQLLSFEGLPNQINGIAFSADGRTLAATCHDGSVRIWHTPM